MANVVCVSEVVMTVLRDNLHFLIITFSKCIKKTTRTPVALLCFNFGKSFLDGIFPSVFR